MLINAVRFTGGIGTVGVFVPQDPGAKDDLAKQGKAAIDFGTHWFKGQTMGTGQAPVKRYNRQLRDLIAAGKATPSWIVSHEISLDQAADAYKNSTPGPRVGPRFSSSPACRLRRRETDMPRRCRARESPSSLPTGSSESSSRSPRGAGAGWCTDRGSVDP
jgi:hypothetical protein